jgi:hypothetical protein
MQQAAQLQGTAETQLAAVAQTLITMAEATHKANKAKIASAKPTKGSGLKAAKAAEQAPSVTVVITPDAPKAKRASKGKKATPEQEAAAQAKLESAREYAREVIKAVDKAAKVPALEPGVYKNRENRSTIVFSVGSKLVHHIPMDATLSAAKMSIDRFKGEYMLMADYNIAKAAAQYLAGASARTPGAEKVLQELAKAAEGKPLAQGELVALMSRTDEEAAAAKAAGTAPTKAARTPAAPRAPKVWADAAKVLKAGAVNFSDKVRPGTFRYALMDAIVKAAAKGATKAEELLGKVVMEGKPGIAKVDIEFAAANKYITLG